MKNNTRVKKINVSFVVCLSIFGALALSAIVFFHLWQEAEWVKLYLVAMRWLVLPVLSLVVGYTATIDKAPKGWVWLAPVILGFSISLVERATYGSFSIVLLGLGALAALFGFTFAKMDRKEKAREAKRAAKKAGIITEEKEEPIVASREDDYNPGADYVPDENDTWADEVLAEEGYGEIKVDYAEPDPDFSIDSPDEACEECETEASVDGENVDADDVVPNAGDDEEAMPEDEISEDSEPDSKPDEVEETSDEAALDGDSVEDEVDADGEEADSDMDETNDDGSDSDEVDGEEVDYSVFDGGERIEE